MVVTIIIYMGDVPWDRTHRMMITMANQSEIQAVQAAMLSAMNSNDLIRSKAEPRCLSALNNPETVGKNIDVVREQLRARGLSDDIATVIEAFVAYSWSLVTCKGGWSGCTKNGARIVSNYVKQAKKAPIIVKAAEPAPAPVVATPKAPEPPKAVPEPRKDIGEITDPTMYRVAWYVENGYHVLLTGLAGVGKTYMIETLARIKGWNFYIITAPRMASDVAGFVGPNGRVDVPVTVALQDPNGILLIDEIDRAQPDALIPLNSLLANGYMNVPGIGLVYAYDKFRCVATANTSGMGGNADMVTAKKLDQSTRDRFMFVEVRWDRRVPEGILARMGCPEKDARAIVNFIGDVRRACIQTDGCSGMAPSYRAVGAFYRTSNEFGYDAAFPEVLERLSVSSDALLALCDSLVCTNRYAKAFKAWAVRYAESRTTMPEYDLVPEVD